MRVGLQFQMRKNRIVTSVKVMVNVSDNISANLLVTFFTKDFRHIADASS